jgi:SMI1 / KNR4 family (SUKH-1)
MTSLVERINEASITAPASIEQLQQLESEFGAPFPEDYKQLMLSSNGIRGFIDGETYIHLWSTSEIPSLNTGYCTREFAPDFIIFGSDGGGEAFAFDRKDSPTGIVMVTFVSLGREDALSMGRSLENLFDKLVRLES